MLFAWTGLVNADVTGILVEIGEMQADWEFSDHSREAKDSVLAVRLEERAKSGLAVGGVLAYHSLRLDDRQGSGSTKFEVTSLGVYLRQEFAFNEWSGLEGQLDYRFHTRRENTDDDRAELDWSEVDFELGLAFRVDNWRIVPFARYTWIDGDTSDLEDGGGFELADSISSGLRFDIFVETTAYISIELQGGAQTGGFLKCVRRY